MICSCREQEAVLELGTLNVDCRNITDSHPCSVSNRLCLKYMLLSRNTHWQITIIYRMIMNITSISKYLLALLFAGTLLSGCWGQTEPDETCNATNLKGHWIHSYEEDSPNNRIRIFRPANFKTFPSSRYRAEYVFNDDGSCKWYYLAPNDGHHFRNGTWRCDRKESNVIHIYKDGIDHQYRIVELTDDILRLEAMQ